MNIFEAMKNDFNHNLDRNMYITLKHPDLPTPIVLGPLNFQNDSIEDIIDKINVKITKHIVNINENTEKVRGLEQPGPPPPDRGGGRGV